jgi:hypothetical protein
MNAMIAREVGTTKMAFSQWVLDVRRLRVTDRQSYNATRDLIVEAVTWLKANPNVMLINLPCLEPSHAKYFGEVMVRVAVPEQVVAATAVRTELDGPLTETSLLYNMTNLRRYAAETGLDVYSNVLDAVANTGRIKEKRQTLAATTGKFVQKLVSADSMQLSADQQAFYDRFIAKSNNTRRQSLTATLPWALPLKKRLLVVPTTAGVMLSRAATQRTLAGYVESGDYVVAGNFEPRAVRRLVQIECVVLASQLTEEDLKEIKVNAELGQRHPRNFGGLSVGSFATVLKNAFPVDVDDLRQVGEDPGPSEAERAPDAAHVPGSTDVEVEKQDPDVSGGNLG